jgi:redox-regulated HSP33 family molecular chaperone
MWTVVKWIRFSPLCAIIAWQVISMKDYLVKAYAFGGTVRIYGAITTHLVEHARQIHDTWPAATAAFGRVLTASVIMGAMYKGDQTLSIRINGGGPIGNIVTTNAIGGTVRGYVQEPHVHMSTNDDKLAVGHVVGNNGLIHVTKDLKVRDIFTSSRRTSNRRNRGRLHLLLRDERTNSVLRRTRRACQR